MPKNNDILFVKGQKGESGLWRTAGESQGPATLPFLRRSPSYTPQSSHSCFSLEGVVFYHLACVCSHLAWVVLTLGLFAHCETNVWEFMRRNSSATLGQGNVSSLRLKLTITRRHACRESNYSYYRGNTTAIPWLEKIARIVPVAKPLTSIETKHTHTKYKCVLCLLGGSAFGGSHPNG